jgi:UDP-glucose 4-epimerase
MKILVTGGAGFIGSNIVARLLTYGHEPVVLDDLSSGFAENLVPDVQFVNGDVRDAETVKEAVKGCDVVLHLAASVGNARSIADPANDAAINLVGTINVLEGARRAGVSRVVFSSSAGIFGELKTLPIREDHPQDPDSPYGASKLAAEKVCLVYNKLHGMRNVCLRYFNVYGRGQRYDAYGNVIPIFADRLLRGIPLIIYGDGEQTRDFVNARDVAEANIAAAFSDGAAGAFNIGSATRVTINRLAALMQRAAGVEAHLEHAPPRPGDVRDSLAAVDAAREAFDYRATVDLNDGLVEYMEWIKSDPVTLRRLEAEVSR